MAFNHKTNEELLADLKALASSDPQKQALANKILDEILDRSCRITIKEKINQLRKEIAEDLPALDERVREIEDKKERSNKPNPGSA